MDFMNWFSWKRIATIATGGALTVVGVVFAQPLLVASGVAIVSWAVPFVEDTKPKVLNGDNTLPKKK